MAIIKRVAPLFLILIIGMSSMALASEDKLIAYYFHGNARCPTCYKMEQYAREAIEDSFKAELANGMLVFKAINVEEEGNEHFVSDYHLYTKSLVISHIENGRETQYKNLTKIWEYARDKKKFLSYVADEINGYLKDVQK